MQFTDTSRCQQLSTSCLGAETDIGNMQLLVALPLFHRRDPERRSCSAAGYIYQKSLLCLVLFLELPEKELRCWAGGRARVLDMIGWATVNAVGMFDLILGHQVDEC
jgi:hypothetical protein